EKEKESEASHFRLLVDLFLETKNFTNKHKESTSTSGFVHTTRRDENPEYRATDTAQDKARWSRILIRCRIMSYVTPARTLYSQNRTGYDAGVEMRTKGGSRAGGHCGFYQEQPQDPRICHDDLIDDTVYNERGEKVLFVTNSRLLITQHDKPMLQLRGLPYSATVDDILEWMGKHAHSLDCSDPNRDAVQVILNRE
ncbi:unnamed protein product, partial [Amoebophrya sp. A25]